MSTVFISYASPDRERIKPVVDRLRAQGYHLRIDRPDTFGYTLADRSTITGIPTGERWRSTIWRMISSSGCTLALGSTHLFESDRKVWREEIAHAHRLGKLLFAQIDDFELNDELLGIELSRHQIRRLQLPDAGDPLDDVARDSIDRLLDDVARVASTDLGAWPAVRRIVRSGWPALHFVLIGDVYLAERHVSERLWRKVMPSSRVQRTGEEPISAVSGIDAARFTNLLCESFDLPPNYQITDEEVIREPFTTGFRLPTAGEWSRVTELVSPSIAERDAMPGRHEMARQTSGMPHACGLHEPFGYLQTWLWEDPPVIRMRGRDSWPLSGEGIGCVGAVANAKFPIGLRPALDPSTPLLQPFEKPK